MSTKIIGVTHSGIDDLRADKIRKRSEMLGYTVRFGNGKVPDEWYRDCEIIFGNPKPPSLAQAKELRWLQVGAAGVEQYVRPGALPENVLITNISGAFGIGISEHMLSELFVLYKKFDAYIPQQQKGEWTFQGPAKMVYGSLVTVVGLGDIGSEFAKRIHAMGAYVRAVKRTLTQKPCFVDELYTEDQLEQALEGADIVALCLPDTPQTINILNRERIDRLKKGAVIMNVGRGTAIDQEAMIEALKNGHLGGACLDVTVPEPLPSDNPLWNLPNVILTPHVSGRASAVLSVDKAVEIFLANLEDYAAGRPLKRSISRERGY